ncbi:MAG: hypothetical protein GY941_22375 [Planctomycetes bacterium]|nr:hypothetical protein [Planctomycetota bacterium]
MATQFKEELLTDANLVVNCTTEEQAKTLLKWAHSKGKKWGSGGSYLNSTNWEEYRQHTCYNLTKGRFGGANEYRTSTILSYEEALAEPEWQPKRGDRVLVWDDHKENAVERIFLAEIKGVYYPIYCVADCHEDGFENGETFDLCCWANMKPLPTIDPAITELEEKIVAQEKLMKEMKESLNNMKEKA